MNDIRTRYMELRDDRDESTLHQDLLDALPAGKRELWEREFDFDIEHRSEYFAKYGEAEFEQRLEADIVRLFES